MFVASINDLLFNIKLFVSYKLWKADKNWMLWIGTASAYYELNLGESLTVKVNVNINKLFICELHLSFLLNINIIHTYELNLTLIINALKFKLCIWYIQYFFA